jgi:hypothetical protein
MPPSQQDEKIETKGNCELRLHSFRFPLTLQTLVGYVGDGRQATNH